MAGVTGPVTSQLPDLLAGALKITLIDLLLAGDNALVIAMAVRDLPRKQRRMGILLGSLAAVVLRIGLTAAAASLLNVQFIKLAGGALILWIAIKVLTDAGSPPPETEAPKNYLKAVWFIVFADITMSMDNVLAIAGASRGHLPLIIFGLGLSIPLVVFSSNLLALMMDRYSWIVYVGSAILGQVGAEMMMTDPFTARALQPSSTMLHFAEGIAILCVLAAGMILNRSSRNKPEHS